MRMGLGVPRRRNCLETPRAVLEAASISETVSLERITDCQMEEEGYISREGRGILISEEQYQRIKSAMADKIDENDI